MSRRVNLIPSQSSQADLPGLYLHVPFCKSKCPYCDFYSTCETERSPAFLLGMAAEADRVRDLLGENTRFDSLYVGGGTPSCIPTHSLERLLATIDHRFDFAPDAERTLEVNPADVTPDVLGVIRDAGVSRISLGVQSFDDEELAFLSRRHTGDEAATAIEEILAAGFADLCIDLIHGLPTVVDQGFFNTLARALEYEPVHLSCYGLTISSDTPFGQRAEKGEPMAAAEEAAARIYLETCAWLEESGYHQYEVSNFSRGEQHRSRHNQKYWNRVPYLGLGPAAHSFDGRKRWWNQGDLDTWLMGLEGEGLPIEAEELVDPEQARLEALALGLRTTDGVLKVLLVDSPDHGAILDKLLAEELVHEEGDRIQPTTRGLLYADGIASLFA